MRMIVASYLRTLRERDEFDRLLPDLTLAMGYTPLVRPQTGVRQYGVDLPVVGCNPDDGIEELVLFVIKQGDIGRSEWTLTVQAVRPSLEEVVDVYLLKHIEPAHQGLRKRIVLVTTGDMKQDTQQNWNGFVERNRDKALFEFWSGDKVADLVEKHMLDEYVFQEADRVQIRKALAFAGERDYDMVDLDEMLNRQLGLGASGDLLVDAKKGKSLAKALTRLNLSLGMFVKAARDAGDTRQALWAAERFLLKSWHRIQLSDEDIQNAEVIAGYDLLKQSYFNAGIAYVEKLAPYANVRDGMSGHTLESAEYAVMLLEHVGLISSVGLAVFREDRSDDGLRTVTAIADVLCEMLRNMPATASPRLDENAIDITLALLFLAVVGRNEEARTWLSQLYWRFVASFALGWGFPISSDSLDDLVDVTVNKDEAIVESVVGASWLAATLAVWGVVYDLGDEYKQFVGALKQYAQDLKPQLWHPDRESANRWYFADVHMDTGGTDVFDLPSDIEDLGRRMDQFLEQAAWNAEMSSSAVEADFLWLDFLKGRHYRFPLSASMWYPFREHVKSTDENQPREAH